MASPATHPEVLVVFDIETTGLDPEAGDEIVELGAVPIVDGAVREDCAFWTLVDPDRSIPPEATAVTGITDEMVHGKPRIEVVLPEFLRYCGPHPLVAQNAEFNLAFIQGACRRLELPSPPGHVHDTRFLSKQLFPGARKHNLDDLCYRLDIETGTRHRSIDDARVTAQAFLALRARLIELGRYSEG